MLLLSEFTPWFSVWPGFFPQIHPACDAGHEPGSRPIEFDRATALFLSGLVKKMVFANFLSTLLVDPVFQDLTSELGVPCFKCFVHLAEGGLVKSI